MKQQFALLKSKNSISMTSFHLIAFTSQLFLLPFFLFLLGNIHSGTFISSSFAAEDQVGSLNSNAAVKCKAEERRVLLILKQGLTDPSGRLSSWEEGGDCCEWVGVKCSNSSGNVIQLDLRNPFPSSDVGQASMASGNMTAYEASCLGGNISSSLVKLRFLEFLDFSLNDFQGIQIPEFMGEFPNLRYLNLSFSSFSGEIPPHIGNLPVLNYLDINANSLNNPGLWTLQASSLEWLIGLASLTYLDLGNVNLNELGTDWLENISMLSSLEELHLQSCNLQGFPETILFNNSSLSVVDLSFNSLNSSIPGWLFNLTSLQRLDLSSNSLQGPIPKSISKLLNLEILDLSSNGNIGGAIPETLGFLCKLKILDLSASNFSGSIAEFLSVFSSCPMNILESLDLSANQLTGEIPDQFEELKSLELLDISSNSFYGSIPSSFGNLSSLKELDLSFNNMNGSIPPNFGHLSKLTDLYLQANSWEGVITEAQLMNLTSLEHLILIADKSKSFIFNVTYKWMPPFRFKTLHIQDCSIGPRFPVWLLVQDQLTSVTLKNVGIADTISEDWFSKICAQLTYLDLSNNQIKAKLPTTLESLNINAIDLSFNRFEGPLPLWHTNTPHLYLQSNAFTGNVPSNINELMPRLQYLYLSDNNLNGGIPSSLCVMENLEVLSLRKNKLSGELPQCWNQSSPLWVLDVANNNLTGSIPSSLGLLGSLNILLLNNNSLYGEIPDSLKNCSLNSIDVGGNRLSGKLPSWIGETLTEFWVLRFRSNLFHGTIPQSWCQLPILHILDLAHNNLSGVIPSCLNNLTSLIYANSSQAYNNFFRFHRYVYLEEIIVVAKGRELEYSRTLQYVNSIDLSGNSLNGAIPENITQLTALGTLNLSMNHLTGSIPRQIGNLRWMETLDLSFNNLSGAIPESISDLTSLSHLNLSYNPLLEGRIPSGSQLQTLHNPSIYVGNPLLCGMPLDKKCEGDPEPSDIPSSEGDGGLEDDAKNDSDMVWFFVSMGSGFAFGLFGVCSTLWWKESWRKAYFRFVRIL